MTQVISLVAPAKAMTPAQSPMELDDQEGPRGFRPTADTPGSPSPRLSGLGSKKRAASINTSEANYARLEKLRIDSPNNMDVNTSQDLICLCTPAPKIPRPRNGEFDSFCLFCSTRTVCLVQQTCMFVGFTISL